MKLEIEVGQRAIAIEKHGHRFKDGEVITFKKYGSEIVEEDYYEYVFLSENDNLQQWLLLDEFELKEIK